MNDEPEFNLRSLLDQYLADGRLTVAQAESIVDYVTLSEIVADDDLDALGLQWVREFMERRKTDSTNPVALFFRDAALGLASERQKHKYQVRPSSRDW